MGGLRYRMYRLALIVAALVVAAGLAWTVNRTRAGMLLRAGASNAPMVAALGVDVDRLFAAVFGVGAMLAGFAGVMAAPLGSVEPGMGDNLLILAFVVIVIGGVGAIRGAFVAALLVGLVDSVGRGLVTDGGARGAGRLGGGAGRPGGGVDADLSGDGGGAGGAAGRDCSRPPGHEGSGMSGSGVKRWRALVLFAVLALLPFLPLGSSRGYVLLLVSRVMVLGLAALSLDLILGAGGHGQLRPCRLSRHRRLCRRGAGRQRHRRGLGGAPGGARPRRHCSRWPPARSRCAPAA